MGRPDKAEDDAFGTRGLEVTASDVGEFRLAGRDVTQIINNYQNMDKDQLKELVEEMVRSSIMRQISEIDVQSNATSEIVKKGEKTLVEADAAQNAGVPFNPDEYMKLATVATRCGRIIIAEGYVREALRLYERENIGIGMVNATIRLGHYRTLQSDYPGAIEHYQHAMKLGIEIDYPKGKADSLGRMAWAVFKQGHRERAFAMFREAIQISRELENNVSLKFHLNNLGSAMVTSGNFAEGQNLLEESLQIDQDLGEYGDIQKINLARVALFKGELDKAKLLLEGVRTHYEEETFKRGIGTCLYYQARIHLLEENFDESGKLAVDCRDIFQETGDENRADLASELILQIAERSTLNEIVDF